MPFDQCLEIDRQFHHFPHRPGLYAVRHHRDGLLYLGKTNDLRTRFNGGHKAFTWAWLDLYPPTDVRIAVAALGRWGNPALLFRGGGDAAESHRTAGQYQDSHGALEVCNRPPSSN